jgi:hypothetical protein
MAAKRSKRFPLLLYTRFHQLNNGLSKFLIVMGIVLTGAASVAAVSPALIPSHAMRNILLQSGLVLTIAGIARLSFTLFVAHMAYVECRAKSLKIQTPFLPLLISYRRIRGSRPSVLREIFPPETQKRHHKLLQAYWGETVIAIELNQLPMSPRLLRLMMGPHFFTPDQTELILLVKDWMKFSRSLDQALNTYRTRRAASSAPQHRYHVGQ